MNANDPLAQLRDIHTPDPVSWWPLAPGWWVLITLLILLIVTVFLLIRRAKNKVTTEKLARQELEQLMKLAPGKQSLIKALHLIRRLALAYHAPEKVANANLYQLMQLLVKQHSLVISQTSLELMADYQYRPNVTLSNEQWQQLLIDLQKLLPLIPTLVFEHSKEANNV